MIGRNRQFRRVYRENRFHPQQTHQKRTALSRLHFYSGARMARPKRAFWEGRPSPNIVKRDVLENARTKNVAETRVLEGPAAPNIVKNVVSLLGPFRNACFGRVRRPQTL